jgi:hypothetical protein
MLPTFQVMLPPLCVAFTGAPRNPPQVNWEGRASRTTTPGMSRPGTGPFPKMRRHT